MEKLTLSLSLATEECERAHLGVSVCTRRTSATVIEREDRMPGNYAAYWRGDGAHRDPAGHRASA